MKIYCASLPALLAAFIGFDRAQHASAAPLSDMLDTPIIEAVEDLICQDDSDGAICSLLGLILEDGDNTEDDGTGEGEDGEEIQPTLGGLLLKAACNSNVLPMPDVLCGLAKDIDDVRDDMNSDAEKDDKKGGGKGGDKEEEEEEEEEEEQGDEEVPGQAGDEVEGDEEEEEEEDDGGIFNGLLIEWLCGEDQQQAHQISEIACTLLMGEDGDGLFTRFCLNGVVVPEAICSMAGIKKLPDDEEEGEER